MSDPHAELRSPIAALKNNIAASPFKLAPEREAGLHCPLSSGHVSESFKMSSFQPSPIFSSTRIGSR